MCWPAPETQSKQRSETATDTPSKGQGRLELSKKESFSNKVLSFFFQKNGEHLFFSVWKRSVHVESPRGINSLKAAPTNSQLSLFPERWENQVTGEQNTTSLIVV